MRNIDEIISMDESDLFTVIGTSDENIEKLDAAPYSYWRETFKHLWKNPMTIVCVVIIILLIIMTIVGPLIYSYPTTGTSGICDPENAVDIIFRECEPYDKPSWRHLFGVAGEMGAFSGRDLWSLVWVGARLSLLLGFTVAIVDTVLGIIMGSIWGYFKWLDPIMLEIRNFVYNVPSLLLYIILMKFLQPTFWTIVFVMCMFGWLGLASFIRNQIIIIRNRDYNIASQTLGSSPTAMITHNLLPYLISVIVTVISTAIPDAIASEVGLAYFNLSFREDVHVTLGQVLTRATADNWQKYPHLILAPMVVMVPLTIAFFYFGLVLADATDPKTHR